MRYLTRDSELTRLASLVAGGREGTAGKGSSASRSRSINWPMVSVCPRSVASMRSRHFCSRLGIQRLETLKRRYRHQEVAPHVAHHPLHLPLVIALAGTTKPVLEQVMGLQLGKRPRALAATIAQYPSHRQLGIVVQDALGHTAKEGKRGHVAVQKRLGGLRGIRFHKAAVAVMAGPSTEVVNLALHTP